MRNIITDGLRRMWTGGLAPVFGLLRFMTILPVGPRSFDLRAMLPYFPVVGLAIGGGLAVLDAGLSVVMPRPTAAAVETVFLVVLTGALHLDGVADTADGLYAHRTPERTLDIMKDSRVGAMGLTAVVCTLLIKYAGLAGIDSGRTMTLVLVPALARGGVLFAIQRLPYGRSEAGIGRSLYDRPMVARDLAGIAAVGILCLLTGWRGIWLIVVYLSAVTGLIGYYRKRMGCITGDMMGAMIEILEATLFLAAAMGAGS